MCFVGVRPRPGPSGAWTVAVDTGTTHGRWLGLGTECTWSRYQSHTRTGLQTPEREHARNKTHTHASPLDVTSGWGHSTTNGQRGRGCETQITGWCLMFIVCSLAERDWGKLDKNVLWRNKQLISSSGVSSRNKKIHTKSFHFKHYVNLWPWILKPWYFFAKTSLYIVP